MAAVIFLKVNKHLYLRDPQATELGRNIIDHGIRLIDQIGFEDFTFKKLAKKIDSTEASVYRYFESKHKLLLYVVAWYWHWIEYRIDRQTMNIDDAEQQLQIAIQVLTESTSDDPASSFVDEEILHRVVIAESSKAFLTTQAKEYKRQAIFEGRYALSQKIAALIKEINPKFETPIALASSLIVLAHRQIFYAKYHPDLTELKVKKKDASQVVDFLETLIASL
ncbi:TetR/AcrR family transcriptional regulator [Oligoflexia bacterium]|nr:TetR/AcrR family transcriptional regulator [Oligoflexia bacterium]